MRVPGRRKTALVFLVLGICLVALAVALNVGWILLNLREVALLVFGVVFFAVIITGLVLNTTFLLREIRRNEQQDAFLNAVTHELKTPIASIKLYLETLKTREVAAEKRREFYDIMLNDSNRLLNTVEQVLQAGRTGDGRHLLNISDVDVFKLLRECVKIIQTRYNLPEDCFEFTRTENTITVSGDRTELQAVFTNLLDNAVKYSEKDAKVFIEARDTGEKTVDVRIRDTGVGIAPAQIKRIFKRFYRVPGLSTQKAKGTGLGLFIVQSIVRKHRGKITVESAGEGEGSTFIIKLPKTKNG
ncbi:MAG TPA: HAMP domain-containing sensor histidine kinase [Pyrinomonadaceae bacterium]|nr:HAMP domain-containing sensor histidine kinase [Pyrinomonadaceae bacterium]